MEGKLLILLLVTISASAEYKKYPTRPVRPPTKICDYQGRKIRVGQDVDAGDNCNTCTCQSNGQVTCTQKQCSHSPPVDVCSEPKPTCKGYLTRWYYNSYSSTCEQFTGCKGSGNNFYSRMACLRQCRKKSYAG
uniref:Protein AMBP-like n=1 Tax=Crassostrea virginica TaxID=6565 RepID=A0A8B8C8T8_CRAVI|nr:protein AMBP-like [Crassostrea virginica]